MPSIISNKLQNRRIPSPAKVNTQSIDEDKQQEDDFDELIRKKYNIDNQAFMTMDYKERNQKLYEMLKRYQICVIPEVEHYDNLPHFTIIETSLKDRSKKVKLQK